MATSVNTARCARGSGPVARYLLALLSTLLVAQVGPAQSSAKTKPHVAPANCPVTRPYQSSRFASPSGYPGPSPGHFYFGTDGIWTMLPVDGVLKGSAANGSTHAWLLWFRHGYTPWVEPTPKLKVDAKRVNGTAQKVVVSPAKFLPRNIMIVGIDIPNSGCWQITGRFDEEELAFVVWVPK